MTYRVLLAAADPEVEALVRDLVDRSPGFTLTGIVASRPELLAAVGITEPDVVVLHEEFGISPALELARDLAAGVPEIGVVLLVREESPDSLSAALHAGIRGVAELPLDAGELLHAITTAGEWARALRPRLSADGVRGLGALVALTGAKGGVGTTTLAVHLSLAALHASATRNVCLVDFDIEAGDARSLLDLPHLRDVGVLADRPADPSPHDIDGQLTLHPSGLRVLLAPPSGRSAADVSEGLGRAVLAHLRTRFDFVIVDIGAVPTPVGRAALTMADRSVVVVTPDTLALRAAVRLLDRWGQADVRPGGLGVVVNRATRDADVTQDLVEQVIPAPLLQTTVPADFPALSAATNTGSAERLEDGPLQRAVVELADELGLIPQKRRSRSLARRSGRPHPVTPVIPLPDTAPLGLTPRAAIPPSA